MCTNSHFFNFLLRHYYNYFRLSIRKISSSKKRAVESESEDESEVRVRVVVDNVKAGDASCGISGEVGVVFNVQPIIVNCNGSKNDGENGNCKNNDVKNLKSHKQVKTLKNAALEKTLGTNWTFSSL